jgi:hypothetical protein
MNKCSEMNGSKHSPNLVCSQFLHEYNFGLSLSFSNMLTSLHFQEFIRYFFQGFSAIVTLYFQGFMCYLYICIYSYICAKRM